MHNTTKTYLLHVTLLKWSKELAEVLCIGHVDTTPDFKLCHLQMKLQKYDSIASVFALQISVNVRNTYMWPYGLPVRWSVVM